MPAWLTFFAPYEFAPTVALVCALALIFFVSGLVRLRAQGELVGSGRSIAWFVGLALIYGALQTHFDYWSQHIFFVHRVQHLLLHHVAPFLIALSLPGRPLMAGMPRALRERVVLPIVRNRAVRGVYNAVQMPSIAAFLFVGLIYLWLIPAVHFYAMLNVPLYHAMNWGMALDGLLFWIMVLDPRPPSGERGGAPGYVRRLGVLAAVMFPQIILGAYIGLTGRELYPVYAVCGRIWPVSAMTDQHLGGFITWIPAAMMSAIGGVVVLRRWMRNENPAHEEAHVPPQNESRRLQTTA